MKLRRYVIVGANRDDVPPDVRSVACTGEHEWDERGVEMATLVLPARAEMWSVMSGTARALALSRIAFSEDELSQLSLAVGELCWRVAGRADPDALVECVFFWRAERDGAGFFKTVCTVSSALDVPMCEPSVQAERHDSPPLDAAADGYGIAPVEWGERRGWCCKHARRVRDVLHAQQEG